MHLRQSTEVDHRSTSSPGRKPGDHPGFASVNVKPKTQKKVPLTTIDHQVPLQTLNGVPAARPGANQPIVP
ncbi:hypothetical protein KCM76_23900 [Zooshikella marina]|uniref:hypothetical protein n=1 Tax=Zooshikella ganghwensis TaxID=202772 RepID=UPI001BAF2238|nr:hypothetical protein [Zooshikella ganghwensis]MBU2709061.1 hypothetical protein [Zooshikella ganghwensis]